MTQPSQPERSEPTCALCSGSGYRSASVEDGDTLNPCPRCYKKRVAELEAEVALDEKLLEQRNRLVRMFDCPEHGECVPFAMEEVRRLRAIAKAPSPPAPVAQEKPLVCKRCGGLGVIITRFNMGGSASRPCYMCQPKEDPKPTEAEEPAIVRRMRQRGRVNTLDADDTRQLLAFIDSRKAAVSGRERLLDSIIDDMQPMLEKEVADHAVTRKTLEQCRNTLSATSRELSDLKARPVVDVTKIRADVAIAESWVRLIQRDAPNVAHGPSQQQRSRDALRAIERALESLQPASAKADEKLAPMPSAEPSRAVEEEQGCFYCDAPTELRPYCSACGRPVPTGDLGEREGRKA